MGYKNKSLITEEFVSIRSYKDNTVIFHEVSINEESRILKSNKENQIEKLKLNKWCRK